MGTFWWSFCVFDASYSPSISMMVTLRIGAFGISLLLNSSSSTSTMVILRMRTLVAVGVGESSFSLKFLLLQCE